MRTENGIIDVEHAGDVVARMSHDVVRSLHTL